MRTVRYRTLLAIIGVAPLVGAFALADQLFFHGTWRNDHHFSPEQIVYWTAILTLPHIVASMLSFADREYLAWYKKPLMHGLAIALTLAFIGQIAVGGYASLLILACYTMYHNVQQQFGITAMTLRMTQDYTYKIMKWFFVIPSALGYMSLMLSEHDPLYRYMNDFIIAIGACLVIGTVFAARVLYKLRQDSATPKIGIQYFTSNIAALYISFAMLATGYGFLATIISRLIHDLTAYVIYTTHDDNRHTIAPANAIYTLPGRIGVKPFVICVPIAVAISVAILFIVYDRMILAGMVLSTMNFMHYYMEGHMWKRGTPHRQHAPFA